MLGDTGDPGGEQLSLNAVAILASPGSWVTSDGARRE